VSLFSSCLASRLIYSPRVRKTLNISWIDPKGPFHSFPEQNSDSKDDRLDADRLDVLLWHSLVVIFLFDFQADPRPRKTSLSIRKVLPSPLLLHFLSYVTPEDGLSLRLPVGTVQSSCQVFRFSPLFFSSHGTKSCMRLLLTDLFLPSYSLAGILCELPRLLHFSGHAWPEGSFLGESPVAACLHPPLRPGRALSETLLGPYQNLLRKPLSSLHGIPKLADVD